MGQIASKIEHDKPLIVISMWTLRGSSVCDGGGGMNEYETHLKRGEETDVQVHISGWCVSHLNCKSMDGIAQLLAF